jgi:hypothetical protein
MIRNSRLAAALVAALAAVLLPACETDLSAALDDVRAVAPEVCKDYCEDELTCEWRSTSDGLFEEAFSSEVRRCIIDCAFLVDEGAYVSEWSAFEGKPRYVAHVAGSTVEDVLACLFDLGAYACVEGEDEAPDSHELGPITESQCKAAATCLVGLGTDATLTWHVAGDGTGTCVPGGLQGLSVDLFD